MTGKDSYSVGSFDASTGLAGESRRIHKLEFTPGDPHLLWIQIGIRNGLLEIPKKLSPEHTRLSVVAYLRRAGVDEETAREIGGFAAKFFTSKDPQRVAP